MRKENSDKSIRIGIDGTEIGLGWLARVKSLANTSASRNAWHSHREAELFFFLKGEASYEIDGRIVRVSGGSVFLIPAGTRHRAVGDTDAPSVRIALFFRPGARGAATAPFTAAEYAALTKELKKRALEPCPCPKDVLAKARAFLNRMIAPDDTPSASARDPLTTAERRLACAELLCGAVRAYRTERTRGSDDASDVIREAVSYLESHCAERLPIERLVRHIGYGHTQFFTLFRKATGTTPNDYLLRFRIAKAKHELETGRSVRETAAGCGFSTPGYFCTVFKRFTGMTPEAWRRQQ